MKIAIAAVLLLALAGCGTESKPKGDSTPTAVLSQSPTAAPTAGDCDIAYSAWTANANRFEEDLRSGITGGEQTLAALDSSRDQASSCSGPAADMIGPATRLAETSVTLAKKCSVLMGKYTTACADRALEQWSRLAPQAIEVVRGY